MTTIRQGPPWCWTARVFPALVVMLAAQLTLGAGVDAYADFSDQVVPVCRVSGLNAYPPEGWFAVPVESGSAELQGCQMLRVRDGDAALVGMVRVLSLEWSDSDDAPPWENVLVSIEHEAVAGMGYSMGEVIWVRDSVPVQGQGFANGRAVGFAASIEGNPLPQQAHFLLFDQGTTKYVVTLLTPGPEVDDGSDYQRNTTDFGAVIRSVKVPASDNP